MDGKRKTPTQRGPKYGKLQTFYMPKDLADAFEPWREKINLSAVCQRAVEKAIADATLGLFDSEVRSDQ